MKKFKNILTFKFKYLGLGLFMLLIAGTMSLIAQDSTVQVSKSSKPVKNTFHSVWLIDNQTIMVPVKGTFEMDFQHRFGTINNGYDDFWGLFANSNIRMGFNYAPIEKLYVGFGITKFNMVWDFNAKYALLKQTVDNSMPVSVTVFGNMGIDTRKSSNFRYTVDRFSYFSQVMVARKFNDKFSAQVSPSMSWFNNVEAYVDSKGEIQSKMNHAHFAIATMGRYRISDKFGLIANYDQPLTQHKTNNPHPNIALGIEMTTSSHAFQIFMGNYNALVPQYNNVFNQNDYRDWQFVIGFNITRLWNF
jgi:Membrane bound beta barrel domain (DUF5777)